MKKTFIKLFSAVLTIFMLSSSCICPAVLAENGSDTDENCFSGGLRYVEFTLNTNAPTRTYAVTSYGSQGIYTISWADTNLTTNKDHKIRIEADERAESLSGTAAAKVTLYIDGEVKTVCDSPNSSEDLILTLMSYKTPAIVISNPEYGFVDSQGNKTILLNKFQSSSSGEAEVVQFNGDEIYRGQKAEFKVTRSAANTGASFLQKYDGTKLSFHGKDSAVSGNSDISFAFGKLIDSPEEPDGPDIPDIPDIPDEPDDSDDASIYEKYVSELIETASVSYGFENMNDGESATSFMDGIMFADSGGKLTIQKPDSYQGGNVLCFDSMGVVDTTPRIVFRNTNAYDIVELSFDFMCEGFNTDRKVNIKMNTGWIGDGVSINKNGMVSGFGSGSATGVAISAGEVHNLKLLFDANADKFIFMLDDKNIYSLNSEVDYTFVDYMEFLNSEDIIYFDNISVRSFIARPNVTQISAGDTSVEVVMNTPMQTTERIDGKLHDIDFSSLFSITDNGKDVPISEVKYIESANKFVIVTQTPLVSSIRYTLSLSEKLCAVSGASVSEDSKIDFVTKASDFDITGVTVSDDKIKASLVNNTDSDKPFAMAIIGKNSDGETVFSQWIPGNAIQSKKTVVEADISHSGAVDFEIVFVNSVDKCVAVKNYIYGKSETSENKFSGIGEEYANVDFDAVSGMITVSAETKSQSGDLALIVFAHDDGSLTEAIPFSNDNLPVLTAVTVCGESGSVYQNIKVPSDFARDTYRVYIVTADGVVSDNVIIYSSSDAETLVDVCNTETSFADLSEYILGNSALEFVGISTSDCSSYEMSIADGIIGLRPASGYDAAKLSQTIKLILTKEKLTAGYSLDEVMKKYSDAFGITYFEYASVEDSVRAEMEKVIKNISGNTSIPGYEDLLLVGKIRASALSWSHLKDVFGTVSEKLGADMSASGIYSQLSSENKAQVFKNIREKCANALSIKEISDAFESETENMYYNSQNGSQSNSGSSGGGFGGGGGGSTPIQSVVTPAVSGQGAQKPQLNDIEGHFAQEAIEFFVAKKVVNGYADNSFKPQNSVTRAEFSKIISLAFNIKGENSNFTDVKNSDWYYEAVSALSSSGIIFGDGANFYPQNNITREDAALIIYRILSAKNVAVGGESSFEDNNMISDYAAEAVGAMAESGIILGSNNCFYPKNHITRGEAVVMIYRAFKSCAEEVQ